MHSGFWIAIVTALCIAEFGIVSVLFLLAIIFSIIAGFLLACYYKGKEQEARGNGMVFNLHKSPIALPGLAEKVAEKRANNNWDRRLTGSSVIDKPLRDVLSYTIQDYIEPWYKQISHTDDFIRHAHMSVQKMIINFAEKSKSVDWVPFFTTRLVDDFASHLRLYRRAQQKYRQNGNKKKVELEAIFFDYEAEMEETVCHDHVCLDPEAEKQYLREVSELLLFLLLPPEDFQQKALRYILREVMVNALFLPMLNLLSDPDYVTYNLAWLIGNDCFTSDSLLAVLKTCRSQAELGAVADALELELNRLRARDIGGADDLDIKQQLRSLRHVQKLVEEKCNRLASEAIVDRTQDADLQRMLDSGQKLYRMPFSDLISNNLALAKFQEFLELQNNGQYLQFYLDASGYRLAAETFKSETSERGGLPPDSLFDPANSSPKEQGIEKAKDTLRVTARSIYQNHLQDSQPLRVQLVDHVRKRIWHRICTEQCDETLFDEARQKVYEQLETFYPSFQRHILYVRLLLQLDLLKSNSLGRDLSHDNVSLDGASTPDGGTRDEWDLLEEEERPASLSSAASGDGAHGEVSTPEEVEQTLLYYSAKIAQIGLASDHGQRFAIYRIAVTRHYSDGTTSQYDDVFRRYSDFHDLHMFLRDKFEGVIGKLQLPGKRMFNNTDQEFLEKRKNALDDYLQVLVKPELMKKHPKLSELLGAFLSPDPWEKTRSQLQRKLDSVVNPVVSAAKNVATGLDRGVESVLQGLDQFLTSKQKDESGKVGASLDEDSSNIPLRIMLLMLNELFDLRHKSQWFRRKMMALMKQIISAFSGDNINKQIVDRVEWLVSTEQMAVYISRFRDSMWPEGVLAEKRAHARSTNDKLRTAVLCRAKLLGCVPENMETMLGSEAVRRGIHRLFDMLQQRTMNRRLLYVLLEASLQTLFPDNKFPELFQRIHAQSERVDKRSKDKKAKQELERTKGLNKN